MIVYLVFYCVGTINLFPKSGSFSQNLSPRELFLEKRINYKKECKIGYGDYVQASEDDIIINTMKKQRTVGSISLGPSGYLQAGYIF
jgi:hypothetical protein